MAITRIWQCGLETGNLNEFTQVFDCTATTAEKKTGSYALGDGNAGDYVVKTVPATRQIRTGFYFYGNQSANCKRFRINSTALIELESRSDGSLWLYVNGVNQDTSPNSNMVSWQHIGVDVKIDASSGWVSVYRDGVEIMSFTGNTGNEDITSVYWGHLTTSNYYWCYYDDLYIDDTTGETSPDVVPIKRFYPVFANGNGNYADWDGSDGNKVDNYALINEVPASDSNYVQVISTDQFDSYAMSTFTLAGNQHIIAIIPTSRVKRTGTTEEVAIGTRLSSTDVIGSNQIPNTSYSYLFDRQEEKPGGGSWSQSDLDSFETVIKSRGTY